MTCAHCGRPFRSKRRDAAYCSVAHKQAAYRRRQAAPPVDRDEVEELFIKIALLPQAEYERLVAAVRELEVVAA